MSTTTIIIQIEIPERMSQKETDEDEKRGKQEQREREINHQTSQRRVCGVEEFKVKDIMAIEYVVSSHSLPLKERNEIK